MAVKIRSSCSVYRCPFLQFQRSYFRIFVCRQADRRWGGSAAAADVAVSGFVRRSLVQDWPRGPLYEQPQINAPATVAVTPVNFAWSTKRLSPARCDIVRECLIVYAGICPRTDGVQRSLPLRWRHETFIELLGLIAFVQLATPTIIAFTWYGQGQSVRMTSPAHSKMKI